MREKEESTGEAAGQPRRTAGPWLRVAIVILAPLLIFAGGFLTLAVILQIAATGELDILEGLGR